MSRVVFIVLVGLCAVGAHAQVGGVRGVVMDSDFEVPLPGVKVLVSETGQETVTGDTGSYYLEKLDPGSYTLMFSKGGYSRFTKPNVVVTSGRLSEVEASLAGEYEEMDELVVRDIQLGGASEIGLLNLRMESSSLMDSVGADMMKSAGASDAASALRLVSGTTVQDGKYAVVRGLPDRYVVNQMNGVRLPTADPNKRAVQLDQFPATLIESIQVSKTFTPDQQGDASGGAVNVITKGIPDERHIKFSIGTSYNTQFGGDDFLTYDGGGVTYWGQDDGGRGLPPAGITPTQGQYVPGATGVSRGTQPLDYKWSLTAGDKHTFDSGLTVGGMGTFYHKNEASYVDGKRQDKYWQTQDDIAAGITRLSPATSGDDPGTGPDFTTSLFDIESGTAEVQWGGALALGVEIEDHKVEALYMYTRVAEDTATLAEDTRGKGIFDPGGLTNQTADSTATAPYIRNETLVYRERTTETLQFDGVHTLPFPEFGDEDIFRVLRPVFDWTVAKSGSSLLEPDKRILSHTWSQGYETFVNDPNYVFQTDWLNDWTEPDGSVVTGPLYHPIFNPDGYRPQIQGADRADFYSGKEAGDQLGNFQRVWKNVEEDSSQFFLNGKVPFANWSGNEGFLKLGYFQDKVERSYSQETYSNKQRGNPAAMPSFDGSWDQSVSQLFGAQEYPIYGALTDVDYDATQDISAWYYMIDFPLFSFLKVQGGMRFESTELKTDMRPESEARKLLLGASGPIAIDASDNADFSQDDALPSIGFEFNPWKPLVFRGNYAETVARQTFKELVPIAQQEYAGAPIFSGNPDLQMSALKNYDLRLDYSPFPGALISGSWFAKDIEDPIEYVQAYANVIFTTPVNFPKGEIEGWEFEVRQQLGAFWDPLEGFGVGGNVTLIDGEVTQSEELGITRDMLGMPEFLYNLYLTYDIASWGTKLGLFYSVKGDTLIVGNGQADGNFIPDIYQKEVGTLNFTVQQTVGDHWILGFKMENITNPDIQTVYRFGDAQGGGEQLRSSYTKGTKYSIGASYAF